MSGIQKKLSGGWNWIVSGFRIATTRLATLAMVGLAMFTQHARPEIGWQDAVMEWGGFLLVAAGIMGRIWCSVYIAGKKKSALVTEGPYSLVRNPLYLFSFIGAFGVALGTKTFTIPALLALAFALYYPFVIRNEEIYLKSAFGKTFEEYRERVPAFVPKITALVEIHEPDCYATNPRLVRREIQNTLCFLLAFAMVRAIEGMQKDLIVPVIGRIY